MRWRVAVSDLVDEIACPRGVVVSNADDVAWPAIGSRLALNLERSADRLKRVARAVPIRGPRTLRPSGRAQGRLGCDPESGGRLGDRVGVPRRFQRLAVCARIPAQGALCRHPQTQVDSLGQPARSLVPDPVGASHDRAAVPGGHPACSLRERDRGRGAPVMDHPADVRAEVGGDARTRCAQAEVHVLGVQLDRWVERPQREQSLAHRRRRTPL